MLNNRLCISVSIWSELCTAQKNQLSLALCYVRDSVSHKSPSWNAAKLRCQEANISRHILWVDTGEMCSKKRRRSVRRRDEWPWWNEMVYIYIFFYVWKQVDEKKSCTKRSCSLLCVSDYLLKGKRVWKPEASQAGVLKADRLACICAPCDKVKSPESSQHCFCTSDPLTLTLV